MAPLFPADLSILLPLAGLSFRSEAWGARLAPSVQRPASVRRSCGWQLVVRAAVFDQLSSSLEQVWTKLKTQGKGGRSGKLRAAGLRDLSGKRMPCFQVA